jgi:uncharacterized protein (TIGR03790 family)
VPKVVGRLRAADIGLVINTADPYSVAVGQYYARRRGLQPAQVLRLSLPVRPTLTPQEFARLQEQVAAAFGEGTQALALAWAQPHAVACNSLTGALALGFDAALCANPCGRPARSSSYANSATARPWATHGLRPAMLLAAETEAQAMALIDRGVAADGSLAQGAEPPQAWFLSSADAARGVRQRLYPPAEAPLPAPGLAVEVRMGTEAALAEAGRRVILVQAGSAQVNPPAPAAWWPGALADHLTSAGGALAGGHGQSTALAWIASGATASHGTVSEPCNHLQKFPHPQWLLLHYRQGATAIEAYWKSVLWPQQSLFVGEPLAAPFAPRPPPGAGGR